MQRTFSPVGRLGLSIMLSLALFVFAAGFWFLGVITGDGQDCDPPLSVTGLDTPRSFWPPGVECGGPLGRGPAYVYEPAPALQWIVIGGYTLIFAGVLAFIALGAIDSEGGVIGAVFYAAGSALLAYAGVWVLRSR